MDGFLYIYKITNLVNGKNYIGQSINPDTRWKNHLKISSGGKEKYPTQYYAIHAAINKYGKDNFTFNSIDIEIDPDNIFKLEEYWISYYKSNDPKYGYNLTSGGECLIGDLNPFYGKHHSDKQKEKWSKDRQGNLQGSNNPKVKLNEEQVREIKFSKEKTKCLSEKFNIDRTIIQRIRSGKIWKHIN